MAKRLLQDMARYNAQEHRGLTDMSLLFQALQGMAPAVALHARHLHVKGSERRVRTILVFRALARRLPQALRIHIASFLPLECMEQAERLWLRLRPNDVRLFV